MKITQGPVTERYAAIFGLEISEVLAWIDGYINKPEGHQSLQSAGLYEPTEKDRAVSIMGYVRECNAAYPWWCDANLQEFEE